MMENRFESADVERRIAQLWEKEQAFAANRPERAGAETFSVVIPPPNVTGSLHMGHALNNTLQDILCRYWRMKGKNVLWQPGTDHAGIATQMVVERQLAERGEPGRRQLGREKFLEKVWAWKEKSGGTIINQLKRLGASCDWSRERFTMDEGLSKAVTKVFVQLYKDGLIYKDKRLVNWDPKLQTAISDLEVVQVECRGTFAWARGERDKEGIEKAFDAAAFGKVIDKNPNGHLYYFNYPLEDVTYNVDDPSTYITVATTRPETMLGDKAVAVHPENEKLKHLIGKNVVLPLVGRVIPIVGDDYADPEKGTGAVKITPAHDFNDFEVGKRHKLTLVNILNREGNIDLSDAAYDKAAKDIDIFAGMERFAARKLIVEKMQTQDFCTKIEPHTMQVPHGDRSNVVIEPYLTDQWYVDAKTLAQPALKAVRDGTTNFIPKNWEKTYFDWLENIEPWCISRQLWWGHQIPVWYGRKKSAHNGLGSIEDLEIFVALNELDAITQAEELYGQKVKIVEEPFLNASAVFHDLDPAGTTYEVIWRDEDVLDTWFSSALWPFSTMGWPDDTKELKQFYPTSVLVTGFDIIFFWVARMMMMGLHFMHEVPFKDVYIHALVRDEKGAKMSKSKGNVIDPLNLIDQYGADALRFTLAAMAAQGRDIKLATRRVEGYRNFATKLWNAARFAEMNGCVRVDNFNPRQLKQKLNLWIMAEARQASADVSSAIESFRFNDAANAVYRFGWNIFCDWYVELAKPILQGEDGPAKDETRATAAEVIDILITLLHPFMPFITEELWAIKGQEGPARPSILTLAAWPDVPALEAREAEADIGWLIDVINEIRSVRSEMNVPASAQIPMLIVKADAVVQSRVATWDDMLRRLGRLSSIASADAAPKNAAQLIVRGTLVVLPLEGIIDLDAERTRLSKDISKIEAEMGKIDAKLGNADFIARAPQEVVDENRERRADCEARVAKMKAALVHLQA